MGWIEGLNDAMDYIEANLEGDLDLAHAARLAACTEGQFRRMFSYIAGIGLGEYVRWGVRRGVRGGRRRPGRVAVHPEGDPLVGAATSRLFRNRDGDARDGPLPGAGAGSLGCRGRPGIAAGPSPS